MTSAARELAELVGKLGRLSIEGGKAAIDVEVLDAKMAYGQLRLEVIPAAGVGQLWVDAARVELAADPTPAAELVPDPFHVCHGGHGCNGRACACPCHVGARS